MPAALLLALLAAAPGPAVFRYDVEESTRALTPAGPRNEALAGTVRVRGGKSLWELSASRLPGVSANAVLADGENLVLLDREVSTYTPVSREEFEALFLGERGADGAVEAEAKDVVAGAVPTGAGAPFEGRPTVRWEVSFSFLLVSKQAGRMVRVRHAEDGVVETVAAEPGGPPTPFDDLARLFRGRGEAREALVRELAKVTGLPVRVRIDASSEAMSETVGPGGGPAAKPPVRATWTTTRTVSHLQRRAASEADARAFEVPQTYHVLPLERERTTRPLPR